MTGQSSAVNGCLGFKNELPEERQYLSLLLNDAGYDTVVIGKWHLGALPASFDYYKVLPKQGLYFDPIFYETGATGKHYQMRGVKKEVYEGTVRMEGHSSDRITDSALEWLDEKRNPNNPFFLKLQFKAPHDMFEYAPRYDLIWQRWRSLNPVTCEIARIRILLPPAGTMMSLCLISALQSDLVIRGAITL